MTSALIYGFGPGVQVVAVSKEVVGGKGANLIEMSGLGFAVPPGVVIPTSECNLHLSPSFPPSLHKKQLRQLAEKAVSFFEENVVPTLGYMPLVSVRSGARVSMPGMMDTVLNVGLVESNYTEWSERLGSECFVNCRARLHEMYTKTVGIEPPASVVEQIAEAIGAVFRSWNSERAIEYRKMHGYSDDWGTAVTIQTMVFGNLNAESCSGVLFTRDPANGENVVTGEYLPKAQGEDVVAGTSTPLQLHEMEEWSPRILNELLAVSEKLEKHYRDAQDVEFTVQDGKLWVLQTRNAKRTATAAFKIAHDMATERMITPAEAVNRVTRDQYATLLRQTIDPEFKVAATVTGLPASPGLVTGVAVFDSSEVATLDNAILIRKETSPEDFPAMVKSVGIITSTGGATSHAAVVARGINKPAVVGVTDLQVFDDYAVALRDGKRVGKILHGQKVTLDGETGRVWLGLDVPVVGGKLSAEAEAVLAWAEAEANVLRAVQAGTVSVLPRRGKYYLSAGALSTLKGFKELLKGLTTLPDLHGVIGFERAASALNDADLKFLKLLAVAPDGDGTTVGVVGLLVTALKSTKSAKLRKRWVIHLPMVATESQVREVVDAGWSVVRPVKTLTDLLAATGPVVFDAGFKTSIAQDLDSLMMLLSKAGRGVSEFGRVVGEEDLVTQVLGK